MRFPADVPVLTDGRVTLRAHRADDLDDVVEMMNDPASQLTNLPSPVSRDEAATFLTRNERAWEATGPWQFAIEVAGDGRLAGWIAANETVPHIGEVGYVLHPRARRDGVATAALGLIADWAFAQRGIHTLGWRTIAGNVASWRVAWANGFTFEGRRRSAEPRRGEVLDGWAATLLSTDSRVPKTTWLPQPFLTDGRVRLRPVLPADEERYLETVHDPESDRWLSEIPLARTSEAFRVQVRDAGLGPSLGASVQWAIADVRTDDYVGALALFDLNGLDHRSAEVGYRCHPDARGRGYISAAMRLALRQAFTAEGDGGYGRQRVSLGAGDGNAASQAGARACGFTETGRDRHAYRLANDSVVDLIRFDLLADEWVRRP